MSTWDGQPQFSGCGIFGVLRRDPQCCWDDGMVDVSAMLKALRHRGPDDSGVFFDQNMALGHTRLSILDLNPRAAQPMTRGSFTITYNGEVYNYVELRKELEGLGYVFQTTTDTEVLLHAYQQWGADCLCRLNGMFAFGIWDSRNRTLFLARDRVGIKPLYYHASKDYFVFASEAQAILHSKVVPASLEMQALSAQIFLRSYYEPIQERTLIQGVRLLRPGECAEIRSPEAIVKRTYWSIPTTESESYRELSREELAEIFLDLFKSSVRYRLVSDAPLGAFLSGGLDSSFINAVACRWGGIQRLQSFTIAEGDPVDPSGNPAARDLASSRILAARFAETIEHHEVLVNADGLTEAILGEFTDLAWLSDDLRFIGLYRNYEAIHQKGLKVVLNGQGPDETMGGYIADNPLARLGLEAEPGSATVKAILSKLCLVDVDKMRPEFNSQRESFLEAAWQLYASQPGESLRRAHLFLAKTLMHRTLIFEDFMSMHFGIECRVPFLDHRIVELAFQIPFRQHIREDGSMGKMLVRTAADQIMPGEIVNRIKQPFPSVGPERLLDASQKIYLDHYAAIACSEAVNGVYRSDVLTKDASGLLLRDLWMINSLWAWEAKMKSIPTSQSNPYG